MIALLFAACVQDTETGKVEPDTTPAYTLLVSEPIGAVAVDVGSDPDETAIDGVCVLDSAGSVVCSGWAVAPAPGVAFRQISVGGEGGCGVLVDGGAACWGAAADVVTHDLTGVTSIGVYDDFEVCASDGPDVWCQSNGAVGVNDAWSGVGAVRVDAYLQGMAFEDGAGRLWYSWGSDVYPIEPVSSEPIVSWNGNAGVTVVYVTADGVLAQSGLNRPELVGPEEQIATGVAYADQEQDGGAPCWIRTDGKIDFAWGEAFDDGRYDPTLVQEDYQFVAVACAGKLEPWAITDDGRVARLVRESAPEMPF